MSKNFVTKAAILMFAAAALGFSFAPMAEATPVNYDFTVGFLPAGPIKGEAIGSFSYDSGSIVLNGTNNGTALLTALAFTLNGITYHAGTANTGFLKFNAAGHLIDFEFGSNCSRGACVLLSGSNSWFIKSPGLAYSVPGVSRPGAGKVTYELAPVSVAVPEPGTLGLFGLGALLIGLFLGARRRMY